MFNKVALNGNKISKETKDLMLCLSTGISSLQFSAFNAITNPKKEDRDEVEDFLVPDHD